MQPPYVITVLLNTNRRADTLEALASLRANTYSNQHVIVLDNASTDGSVEVIQQEFPEVEIIALQQNLGYTGNNNVGICAALQKGADWVLVLNEDTVLAPDALEKMIEAGELNPQVGIVGPLVYHFDEPKIIQSAGGALDRHWLPVHIGQNEVDHGQYSGIREVDWVSGCAILVRKLVIEQIGGLDERFFYYWEETDWCLRTREAGWKILQTPQAKIWHKGVQREYQPSPNVTYYCTRNWFLLLAKHKAPASVWAFVWWWTIRLLALWSLKPRETSTHLHRNAMWRGTVDFLYRRWGALRTP